MIDVKTATDDELRAYADRLMPAIEAGALGPLTRKGREDHKARCAQASACYEELMRRHFARKTPEQQRAWIDGLNSLAGQVAPRAPVKP